MRAFKILALVAAAALIGLTNPAKAVDVNCLFPVADNYCASFQGSYEIVPGFTVNDGQSVTYRTTTFSVDGRAVIYQVSDAPATFDTSAGAAYRGQPYTNPTNTDESDDNDYAECSAPGTDQYSVIRQDTGAGVVWVQTNDTRWCDQAGIGDNFWKAQGGE